MRFIPVERIPKQNHGVGPRCDYHKYDYEFKKFIDMNVLMARVELDKDEYSSVGSAFDNLRLAIKRHKVPIKVAVRNNELYLIRRDI